MQPYFFSPRSEAIIAPLPELTGPQRPPAYRPFKYGDFRAARFAGGCGGWVRFACECGGGNAGQARADVGVRVRHDSVAGLRGHGGVWDKCWDSLWGRVTRPATAATVAPIPLAMCSHLPSAGDYADLGEEVQISWYRTEQ